MILETVYAFYTTAFLLCKYFGLIQDQKYCNSEPLLMSKLTLTPMALGRWKSRPSQWKVNTNQNNIVYGCTVL